MIELLEKYPKATKIVKEYYLNKLLQSLKTDNLPEEFREHVKERGLETSTLVKIVGEAPRMLFDVFDENEIIIEILNKHTFSKAQFYYKVNSLTNKKDIDLYYDTRKEAEKAAIEAAFQILEDKL